MIPNKPVAGIDRRLGEKRGRLPKTLARDVRKCSNTNPRGGVHNASSAPSHWQSKPRKSSTLQFTLKLLSPCQSVDAICREFLDKYIKLTELRGSEAAY